MVRLDLAALALAVIVRGAPVPETSSTLAERQFTIGNPWTGIWPPGPPDTPTIVFPGDGRSGAAPSAQERRDIGLGGAGPSELKARLAALQLEYETLSQRYGSRPPSHVAQRLEAIAAELEKYGIAIVKSPDGTTTVITPGKARRGLVIGEGGHANPSIDLVGLETSLEQLMQQYGPNPPHDIYLLEEKIKSILIAYGITIIKSPDGTKTTITPSTKRAAASYDLTTLTALLAQASEQYDGAPPPLGNWLVMRDMTAVLLSYGVAPPAAFAVPEPRTPGGGGGGSIVFDANAAFLQAWLARLQASYGTAAEAPQDILLLEQTIAMLLGARGIAVPGWSAPFPGGPMVPDKTVPGGPMVPSTKTKKRQEDATPMMSADAGLQAAIARLSAPYGAPGAGAVPPLPVFLVMQSAATMLEGRGFTLPSWPPVLGDGSTVIGPSD